MNEGVQEIFGAIPPRLTEDVLYSISRTRPEISDHRHRVSPDAHDQADRGVAGSLFLPRSAATVKSRKRPLTCWLTQRRRSAVW